MSKRRPNRRKSSTDVTPDAGNALGDRIRPWLLGATVALFVATPLLPSEAAPSGYSVSLQMAWFVLFAAFALAQVLTRDTRIRYGATDIAVVVFVLLHTLSALVLSDAGQPRQTLNMLWHWVSFGVAFLMFRQLIRSACEMRACVSIAIALAVCLSMHGYYQYFVSMPQHRQQFQEDPEGMLEAAGVVAPVGSVERFQFENRLKSTEPLATFTLANSLAGFLATWLVCCIGIAATSTPGFLIVLPAKHSSTRDAPEPKTMASSANVLLVSCISALVISGCFLLTKSRTATLALLVGVAVLVIYGCRSGWKPGWKLVTTGVGAVAVLVLLAVLAGGLDLQVITESSMSLAYRIQYWDASLALIADSPLFGCGPGNFQQAYTAYKLPQASETVADPHNFFFEIWATAGTPAILAFVAVFGCAIWQVMRIVSMENASDDTKENSHDGSIRAVYWGALLGVPFGFAAGLVIGYLPDLALLGVGLPVAAGIVWSWHVWVRRGSLPLVVVVAAIVALMTNLSAAGGISFAGVSLTLWLLLAIALNQGESHVRCWALNDVATKVVAVSAVIVLGLFWYSTFNPVVRVSGLLARAGYLQSVGQLREAERVLLGAAEADTYGVDPWQQLAELRLSMWLEGGDAASQASFEDAATEMLHRHRLKSAIHKLHGDWYLRAYRLTNDVSHLNFALSSYENAVKLYPNFNLGHAQLAWARHVSRDREGAANAAEKAMELDEMNPHIEQKLGMRSLFDALRQHDSQPSNPPNVNAEQLMRLLRNSSDS